MNIISILIILFFAAWVTGFFVYYYTHIKKDKFENLNIVTFISDQDVKTFLQTDADGYVQSMTTADLVARNVQSTDEYLKKITSCNINDTLLEPSDRILLTKCALNANEFLQNYTYQNLIAGKDIAKIPWKIAIICNEYEEGLPHTRQDIIFLSKLHLKTNAEHLTSLLIHEKAHIFQRYNPQIMEKLIATRGYVFTGYANDPRYRLRRSNPDINYKVYFDTKTQKELLFTYKSDHPKSITDVNSSNFRTEHPYEEMAYDIANDYLREYLQNVVKVLV